MSLKMLLGVVAVIFSVCPNLFSQKPTDTSGMSSPVARPQPPMKAAGDIQEQGATHWEKQKQMRSAAYQQSGLKPDAEKLLALTTQFKEAAAGSTPNTTAANLIERLREIEKLTHNMQNKLDGTKK